MVLKRKLRWTLELYYKLDRQAKRAQIVDRRYLIQVNDLPPFYPADILFERILAPYNCIIHSVESVLDYDGDVVMFCWYIIHLKVSPRAGAQLRALIYRFA